MSERLCRCRDVAADFITTHQKLEDHCKDTYEKLKLDETSTIDMPGTQSIAPVTHNPITHSQSSCPLRRKLLLREDSKYLQHVTEEIQGKANKKRKAESVDGFDLTTK